MAQRIQNIEVSGSWQKITAGSGHYKNGSNIIIFLSISDTVPAANFEGLKIYPNQAFFIPPDETDNTYVRSSSEAAYLVKYENLNSMVITGFKFVDGDGGLDKITEALYQVDYEHHEIHSGSHYNLCDYVLSAALNDTIEFILTTPDTEKWIHFTFSVFSSLGAILELYEGASGIVGGTPLTPRNNNRNSLNTSDITLIKDPTSISTDGIRASGYLAGAGRAAGVAERNKEFVLKQNTTYLLRITSLANSNNISWCSDWYEHTNKNE